MASDGQIWTGNANSIPNFSMGGNTGQVVGTTGSSYNAILGSTAANAEVVFTGSLSDLSNSNLGTVLRWTDDNNWYKAYIDGTNLFIQDFVGEWKERKGSFIPPAEQRELRDLTRYRCTLVEERARAVNRLQKTLEDTNVKLADVATDILGKSARAMLDALLAGETDPRALAGLARWRLKAKRAALEQALVGELKPHHRFMLAEQLRHIDGLDAAIARVGQEIAARMGPGEAALQEQTPDTQAVHLQDPDAASEQEAPEEAPALTWAHAIVLLCSIPGISRRAAEVILAEIGLDMHRFPSANHLASWAGMCPGNHESAGKRLSGRTRNGSPWLRKLPVEAAHAAAHTKNTYLSAQYRRLAARLGPKKAMVAVGHTILVIVYHVLRNQQSYQELGGNYFEERDRQAIEKRLVRRLQKLGYEVSLKSAPPAA